MLIIDHRITNTKYESLKQKLLNMKNIFLNRKKYPVSQEPGWGSFLFRRSNTKLGRASALYYLLRVHLYQEQMQAKQKQILTNSNSEAMLPELKEDLT